MIDSSYTYTYDGQDTSKQVNVYFNNIMKSLRKIAVDNGKVVNDATHIGNIFGGNNGSIIIVVLAIIGLSILFGSYLIIKKRKQA